VRYYGHRFYSPGLGRFINRDPIEEAGGLNLYGFCGNDGINGFDVMGNRNFFSELWDDTMNPGIISRKVAQDWDHQGRTIVEAVGVIVASYFVGAEVSSLLYTGDAATAAATTAADIAADQIGAVTVTSGSGLLSGAAISGATASTIATVAGGAAAGFTGGTLSAAFAGHNLGQSLSAGLTGAAWGAGFAFAGNELLNIKAGAAPSWAGAENAVVTSAARYGVNAFAERQFGINEWEFDAGLEAISALGYAAFGDPYENRTKLGNDGLFSYIGGFGDRDPNSGWLFTDNPTAHYWGEFLFDANDQILQWQGVPDAGGLKAAFEGGILPTNGHSLGASRLVTLSSLGLINGGSAIALPFGMAGGTGIQAYLGWLDPIANPLNFIFNPEASIGSTGHPLQSYINANPGL
jgi:hypothetical protein